MVSRSGRISFYLQIKKLRPREVREEVPGPDVRGGVEISIQVPLNLKLPCDMPFMIANWKPLI